MLGANARMVESETPKTPKDDPHVFLISSDTGLPMDNRVETIVLIRPSLRVTRHGHPRREEIEWDVTPPKTFRRV
jgi:hypothetical protein